MFVNELDIQSFGELRFIVVFLGSPMVPKYNVDDFLESCGVLVMDIPMVIAIGNTIPNTRDQPFLTCKSRFLDLGPSMMHIILERGKWLTRQREQVLRLFGLRMWLQELFLKKIYETFPSCG